MASVRYWRPVLTGTGVFGGYSALSPTFHWAVAAMKVLLHHRLRMMETKPADDEQGEDEDDDSNASVASWQTSDTAATGEVTTVVFAPWLSPQSGTSDDEPEHPDERANGLISAFIKLMIDHANHPVIKQPNGALHMVVDGQRRSYTSGFTQMRKDAKSFFRQVDRSIKRKPRQPQWYSPISKAVFEVTVGWNLAAWSPGMRMVLAEKASLEKKKGRKRKREEEEQDGSDNVLVVLLRYE